MLLETVQINAEINRRIDWVGEPNHAQPQDPSLNNRPERVERLYEDAGQAKITPNIIEPNNDDEDLQQRQVPIFGKGTYLEFEQQRQSPE